MVDVLEHTDVENNNNNKEDYGSMSGTCKISGTPLMTKPMNHRHRRSRRGAR
jgi:hypothetical protein